jgi:hypothetical protein
VSKRDGQLFRFVYTLEKIDNVLQLGWYEALDTEVCLQN